MSRSYRHGKYSRHSKMDYWRWLCSEPRWWRTLHKHKPRRSATKELINKIYKGYDIEDLAYPLDKKPWIYYW